jgi:hypothetical protein
MISTEHLCPNCGAYGCFHIASRRCIYCLWREGEGYFPPLSVIDWQRIGHKLADRYLTEWRKERAWYNAGQGHRPQSLATT